MSLANPGAAGLPPITAEQLPDDLGTLKRMVLELLASLQERQRDYEALRHRIDLLLRRLYGPRGERFDPNQPLLFAEMVPSQDAADATARPSRPRQPSPSVDASRMAAAACRRTFPASPGITSCPKPSASVRVVGRAASTSAWTRANSSTTGRRR